MPITYSNLYLEARRKLRDAGNEDFTTDARYLIATAAGKNMNELMRDLSLYTSDEVGQKADEMLARRIEGEPLAYITGETDFYGITIKLTPDVLIPRTDTELLVETAIYSLHGKKMDARVIDLCAGSGCVGCAIAKELPAARVTLADDSREALAVAKQNIYLNKLNPRVSCIEIDALLAPPLMLGSFDLLVCNPPYIPTADLETLDDSVRKHEPIHALDGGEDGLKFYDAILRHWKNTLRPGGIMMFEVGINQAESVCSMMEEAGLKGVYRIKDTQGIDRVCFGKLK